PVLAVGGESGAELPGLCGRAQIGVEHGGAERTALALEDEVLHLAGEAQRSDARGERENAADGGSGGAHPVSGLLLAAAVRSVADGVLRIRCREGAPLEIDQGRLRGGRAEVEGEEGGHGIRVCRVTYSPARRAP